MTTAMAVLNLDQQLSLPAHLQGLGLGVTTDMTAVIGDQRNRIGLSGSRFRQVIAGQEIAVWDENYLDVIIVGVVPTVSRLYYANSFSQDKTKNKPPTCYSVDNIAPPIDLATRQSDKCETCQWNIKGSKIGDDGYEGKACSYFRRMAILLPGDSTLYYIDVKSQGLFGESKKAQGKFSMNDYAKILQAQGVDASILVTRLSFDTDKSVPKLLFSANRYVSPEEIADVQALAEGTQLAEYLDINMKTIDISKEESVDEAAPAAAEPEPMAVAPKPTPAAAPKPQVAPRPAAAAAPRPTPTPAAKPVQAAPKPVPQKPTPKPVAKPAPVQVDTGVVSEPAATAVEEVGSPEDLANIMADLGIDLT